jgi:hypothetical protein
MNWHRRFEFLLCCSHHYSSSRHSERLRKTPWDTPPSPQNLRVSNAITLKFNLGSEFLFPFSGAQLSPIWLLLALPATQTMDQER